MRPWMYTNGWVMTIMHEWGNRKEKPTWPLAWQNGRDEAKTSSYLGWLLFPLRQLRQHLHQYEQDLLRCCQCDRMHLQRHESVAPPSQSTDEHTEKKARDTPFLGELLLWCYLHTSVPSHILKEQGKVLLIQQETLGATKITVLDVDHTTTPMNSYDRCPVPGELLV